MSECTFCWQLVFIIVLQCARTEYITYNIITFSIRRIYEMKMKKEKTKKKKLLEILICYGNIEVTKDILYVQFSLSCFYFSNVHPSKTSFVQHFYYYLKERDRNKKAKSNKKERKIFFPFLLNTRIIVYQKNFQASNSFAILIY